MATNRGRAEAAVAGTDHGVYVVDIASGRLKRNLYSKRNGHSEWVTCVAYTGDDSGCIVTGAMDSKLCLWAPSGVRCTDLVGHGASVSCVSTQGGLIASGSYDKSVRLWDARTGADLAVLQGHSAPVLCACLGGSIALTGARDGVAVAWNVDQAKLMGRLRGHKGHVTSVRWLGSGAAGGGFDGSAGGDSTGIFASGAQDGHVRIWDLRARKQVANVEAHVNDRGSGAVGCIEYTTAGAAGQGDLGGGNVLVTAGADASVCVLDPRMGFEVRHRFEEHEDFIYSLHVAGTVSFSGAGNGLLIAHDVLNDRPLWGVGANQAAVQGIGTTETHLVATGDDGNAIVYEF